MELKSLPTQSSAANIAATRALQHRNTFPSVAVPTFGEINRISSRDRMETPLMEENGSNGNAEIPRLRELAEFRFQLRQFLSFSEISSERHGFAAT